MERQTDRLSYDAVIATRNRTDALALSIPLLLAQSRPPERLIVIDSSDDHAPVRDVVDRATRGWSGHVVVETAPPGLPLQRNRGLAHVTAPVVLFPDDDSLFFPAALEEILTVYERDRDAIIAGVAARESRVPPEGVLDGAAYERSASHQRQARLAPLRYRLERRLDGLNPFREFGQYLMERHGVPDWLTETNAVPVEYMTGFRMSFRTSAIRAALFDETLSGHALGEDVDASFAVTRHGLLIGARKAEVFHHKFPSGRGGAYRQGATGVLNRTYILCKHLADADLPKAERVRFLRGLSAYFRLRLAASLPGVARAHGRARIRGILAALGPARALRGASRSDLAARYRDACKALEL